LLIIKNADSSLLTAVIPKKKHLKELLPGQCGKRLVTIPKWKSMMQQRIALGYHSERGDHPWQVCKNIFKIILSIIALVNC
jgi:hypothetical protein